MFEQLRGRTRAAHDNAWRVPAWVKTRASLADGEACGQFAGVVLVVAGCAMVSIAVACIVAGMTVAGYATFREVLRHRKQR